MDTKTGEIMPLEEMEKRIADGQSREDFIELDEGTTEDLIPKTHADRVAWAAKVKAMRRDEYRTILKEKYGDSLNHQVKAMRAGNTPPTL